MANDSRIAPSKIREANEMLEKVIADLAQAHNGGYLKIIIEESAIGNNPPYLRDTDFGGSGIRIWSSWGQALNMNVTKKTKGYLVFIPDA